MPDTGGIPKQVPRKDVVKLLRRMHCEQSRSDLLSFTVMFVRWSLELCTSAVSEADTHGGTCYCPGTQSLFCVYYKRDQII